MPVVDALVGLAGRGGGGVDDAVVAILYAGGALAGAPLQGGLAEDGEVAGGAARLGGVDRGEGDDGLLRGRRPVGDVVLGEGAVVDGDDVGGLGIALLEGGKLHVVVHGRAVAPCHGVVDGASGADVDASGTSVATAVVDDVGTYAGVVDHGTVVERAALVEVGSAGLGGSGAVGNDGGHTEGAVLRGCRGEGGVLAEGRRLGVVVGIAIGAADGHAGTDTRCALQDVAVLHAAVVVYTDGSSVALHHAHAGGLAGVDVAALDGAAAVEIDTAAALGGGATLDDAVAQQGVAHHVDAAAEAGVVVAAGDGAAGVALADGEAVDAGLTGQTLVVAGMGGVVDGAVGAKPYDVVAVQREGGGVAPAGGVVGEGGGDDGVVAREDGLVLQVPAAHGVLDVVLFDELLVGTEGAVIGHDAIIG